MAEGHDPVSPAESVFRRFPNAPDYFNPSLPIPISYLAFRPTNSDEDGISVFRPACGATPPQIAEGRCKTGYYVVTLQVADILAIEIEGVTLTVEPTPHLHQILGHASVPQLNLRLREDNSDLYKLFCARLAEIAGDKIVYRSPVAQG